ncbi:MAG: Holliday junction branch migration protein RuvA [Porticoccus sp.]|nr:Holliday junction branch migration protein RuvA [Porticoccus sp.]MDX2348891.1 Holliday junction branch migration protein RuvA [Porticoccus sp.]
MIGRIEGVLLEKQAPGLLIDVQGIGYEVLVSLTSFFDLPALGEKVILHTHFVVREDAQQLYGFADTRERELFRTLIKVSGVGPKMALAILSGMTATEFVRSVQANDTATLVRLPGVGKKTAERLIVEMRDRLEHFGDSAGLDLLSPSANNQPDTVKEAESALISLGYKPQEAARMVNANAADGQTSQELIRLALKSMVKS